MASVAQGGAAVSFLEVLRRLDEVAVVVAAEDDEGDLLMTLEEGRRSESALWEKERRDAPFVVASHLTVARRKPGTEHRVKRRSKRGKRRKHSQLSNLHPHSFSSERS
jgi:hypothetical protein